MLLCGSIGFFSFYCLAIHFINISIFFVYSYLNGYLSCFQVLAIINKVDMNILIQECPQSTAMPPLMCPISFYLRS